MQKTAIFDLDGCLSQNPYSHPGISQGIYTPGFWENHWEVNPAPHSELLDLWHVLGIAGWDRIILTARPDSFLPDTLRWLGGIGIDPRVVGGPPYDLDNAWCHGCGDGGDSDLCDCESQDGFVRPYLIMLPRWGMHGHRSSGDWKLEVVRMLMQRGDLDIKFVVEDYKPNADVIRQALPVLLYERKRDVEQPR